MNATPIFLFFLFLTYAAYLLATRRSEARHERLEQRVREALQDASITEEQQFQLSRRDTLSGNPTLNRVLGSLQFARNLDRLIGQAEVQITVGRLLLFCFAAGLMATLAAYTVLSSTFVVAVLGITAGVMPVVHLTWVRKRRLRKFLEHLPDALDLMSRSLSVGHAFSESLHQVAAEMPEPVSTEFRIAFEEQKLGLPLKAALQNMADRVPLLDLRICITAILIQRETGGNLAEILEKVSTTIRERFRIMEDFRTITTASRGAAWILCLLPFCIVLMTTAINPQHMSVLFSDVRGHYIIGTAVVMQVLGILSIRKILNIKI